MIYEFKALVYCEKLGKEFGRETHIQIAANNLDDALQQAYASFDRYTKRLSINHKNNFYYDYPQLTSEL